MEEPTHQRTRGAELLFFMLGHCPRPRPNMKPTVGQLIFFTGQEIPMASRPGASGKSAVAVATSPGKIIVKLTELRRVLIVDTHVLATGEPPVQLILAWIASSFSGATVLRADAIPCILYLSQYLYLGTMRSELLLFNCNTKCVIVNMS